MKARSFKDVKKFQDIPNIGTSMTADFKLLGMKNPSDLKNQDPLILYKKLCAKTKARQDPCVLDTFIAAVDFMNGAQPKPWWHYTSQRKNKFPQI